jgi:hypothetical protein
MRMRNLSSVQLNTLFLKLHRVGVACFLKKKEILFFFSIGAEIAPCRKIGESKRGNRRGKDDSTLSPAFRFRLHLGERRDTEQVDLDSND